MPAELMSIDMPCQTTGAYFGHPVFGVYHQLHIIVHDLFFAKVTTLVDRMLS